MKALLILVIFCCLTLNLDMKDLRLTSLHHCGWSEYATSVKETEDMLKRFWKYKGCKVIQFWVNEERIYTKKYEEDK